MNNLTYYKEKLKKLNNDLNKIHKLAARNKLYRKYNSILNIPLHENHIKYYNPKHVRKLQCSGKIPNNLEKLINLECLTICCASKIESKLPISLKKIVFFNCKITDFKFLENLYNLEKLFIINNKKSNISDCKLPISIIEFCCNKCEITDFKFLEDLYNLKKLYISGNKNSNISHCNLPIKLTELECSYCNILDFKFLKNLYNLKKLFITGNNNSNISNCELPFKLIKFVCINCNITDFNFLKSSNNLRIITISN
ncbi:ORF MSV009 leucine rich repeat gene family protein, similar to Amsacta moorei entomopoxvirus Q3 ORF SW:P28854 [Melanoplus sanguinipes entomopoxvirus]|uniref:ORF MSV009 leucine rich repeat gene family protein, similar to Amsacta moorei entomopoxvirus Q3 ORF SW:P28854 n=1 Tax=Melanoplus sanguinipes entomopoxvirus TaxID=83191 RepID=Q9YW83_MSEPV|nr:ORF MSV009 leucine rich repeat gene family protein, similar to Amsacta moorei entomopoxvirus Q3 ORF SW:P28854 [Melanoplus sanguinipes entomopoxvirus]AAC97858.1 ORF MSV009 leucine rich repeat gene family protein, similar to Amsacta moorei entomopoxvirus Q3 ORF SW:P28854 [Melanoplus sanguinipes entomopoxvirus 'O']